MQLPLCVSTVVMKRFYVILSLWRLCWCSLGYFFGNPLPAHDMMCIILALAIWRNGTGSSDNGCFCAVGCNMSHCIYRADIYIG